MNKILGSVILWSVWLWAGSITATIDSHEIVVGDSVILSLAVTGKDATEIPDIGEINGQKVINLQRRFVPNLVHTNGVDSMMKTQILMLEFRPNADMTIPSFSVEVDGEMKTTQPIMIKVLTEEEGENRKNRNFSLEMKIEKTKFYVGEPIVLTLYFKQRTQLEVTETDYTAPQFKDFFSKPIGKGKTYKKGAFTVQELNYLLIAKKSGTLTLDPAHVKISQRSRQTQEGGWFMDVPKWTSISSSALQIEVMEANAKHDIIGDFTLTQKINSLRAKPNKPVTLRLELSGEGYLEDYEGVKFKIPSVTVYSNDAKIESQLRGHKLQTDYQKSFVFVSDHSFTIPSKEIEVYDYATNKIKVLKTKAYRIEIEASQNVVTSNEVHQQGIVVPHSNQANQDSLAPWKERLPTLLALFLAFVLGVFVTLLFKYLPKVFSLLKKKKKFNGEDALRVLYPKMAESKEVEEMVRKLYAIKSGEKGVEIDGEKLKWLVARYRS